MTKVKKNGNIVEHLSEGANEREPASEKASVEYLEN